MAEICDCEPCKARRDRKLKQLDNDRIILEGHIAEATNKINQFNFEQVWLKNNRNAWRRYIG